MERSFADYSELFPGHEALLGDIQRELSDSDGTAVLPGRAFDRFRLVREIGRGGQGTVYLAHDGKLGRDVALKFLGARHAWEPRAVERFRREAGTISRLDHPGLCPVHEIGSVEGRPFFVMPFLAGESLAARISAAQAPPRGEKEIGEVLALVERVARALHVAHTAGVVHRDLKPGNIQVRSGGEPVVLDFGLALDDTDPVSLTLSGELFGTPAYMAPEQLSGDAADSRTDVHALGVVLYECLTLQRPYRAATRQDLQAAILAGDAPGVRELNPSVPRDVEAVQAKAMAREPSRRYASAGEFADELARARRHEPVRARSAGNLSRLWRWARRDPALAGTMAGLVVTLAAGLWITRAVSARVTRTLAEEGRSARQHTARYLLRTADQLWPLSPASIPPMEGWLAEAGQVLDSGELAVGEQAELSSLHTQVVHRRDEAAGLARRSIDLHRRAWEETCAAVADSARHPCYGGLTLAPQLGLVPLGPDPDSGLFEFAHLPTGEAAVRAAREGVLRLQEDSGLVFVLVPAGCFFMGAGPERRAHYHEMPPHAVELGAFFLSKYEMTQGQWLRLTGHNPSGFAAARGRDPHVSLLLPVEWVSWDECTEVLRRFGLVLPSEAQREYAARGGTTTLTWSGEERASLFGAENVADESVRRGGYRYESGLVPGYDDGFPLLAPVGSFRPNSFGFHDVSGNVAELVRDVYASYRLPVRAGDGERLAPESGMCLRRGGSYVDLVTPVHVRSPVSPEVRYWSQGLRPARALDRE